MTKRPPTDMGASAFNRLKALTRSPGQDFNLTLIRYGCERLLYRLSQSPHSGSFMLKGATLFVVWEAEGASRGANGDHRVARRGSHARLAC